MVTISKTLTLRGKLGLPFKFILIFLSVGVIIASYFLYHFKSSNSCSNCNLVIISIDTLRPDHMSTYGYNKNTTPNIDNLAKNSYVFTNMRSVTPFTYPSFAALMTGISPFDSKIIYNIQVENDDQFSVIPIKNNANTLAQRLKREGYTTAAFVNNASLSNYTHIDAGFDTYVYKANEPDIKFNNNGFKSDDIVEKSIEWLNKNKGKKVFLWVHLLEPHSPYQPSDKYACLDPKVCQELKQKGISGLEKERKNYALCRTSPLPQNVIKQYESLYDGEIMAADDLVGRVLNEISRLGLNNNTVIALYGDHGEGFDHNFYFDHGQQLYDSNLRIPFILRIPSNNSKKSIASYLQNTNVMNILLFSLFPSKYSSILNNRPGHSDTKNEPQYFINVNSSSFAVIDHDFKYIFSQQGSCITGNTSEELYDLNNDPQENNNLAATDISLKDSLRSELFTYLQNYHLPQNFRSFMDASSDKKVYFNKEFLESPYQYIKKLGY